MKINATAALAAVALLASAPALADEAPTGQAPAFQTLSVAEATPLTEAEATDVRGAAEVTYTFVIRNEGDALEFSGSHTVSDAAFFAISRSREPAGQCNSDPACTITTGDNIEPNPTRAEYAVLLVL